LAHTAALKAGKICIYNHLSYRREDRWLGGHYAPAITEIQAKTTPKMISAVWHDVPRRSSLAQNLASLSKRIGHPTAAPTVK